MAVHIARLGLVHINSVGQAKPHVDMTIGEAATSSSELRVLVDTSNANTAGSPTASTYLALEDTAGFSLLHFDQTYVITTDGLPVQIAGFEMPDLDIGNVHLLDLTDTKINPATQESSAAISAAVASGLPTSGFEAAGDDDNNYNSIVTAPARQCHYLHAAVGDGGVRISADAGVNVHFYVPANTERLFPGLVIPAGADIQAKKYVDGGVVSTNLAISVW